MGEVLDNPNQQVVRADGSGPGVGGALREVPEPAEAQAEAEAEATSGNPLDIMTKAQLLDHALALGLPVSDAMTKAEIRAAIDEAEAAG